MTVGPLSNEASCPLLGPVGNKNQLLGFCSQVKDLLAMQALWIRNLHVLLLGSEGQNGWLFAKMANPPFLNYQPPY